MARNDERGWKELKARYWGLASLVDEYSGRILDALESLGLAEDTVVAYSTDHGDMMGEHRMVAKGVPYEGAVRVPLLLRLPGVAPRRVPAAVSQVDLVPTLLDALGVAPPDRLHGASLLPGLREGAGAPPPGEVVIEWNGTRVLPAPAGPHGGDDGGERDGEGDGEETEGASPRTIRRGRWKLTVDEDGEHELYDLRDDPCETRNLLFGPRLGEAPGAGEAVDELWARLRAWHARTGDPLALPAPRPWGG